MAATIVAVRRSRPPRSFGSSGSEWLPLPSNRGSHMARKRPYPLLEILEAMTLFASRRHDREERPLVGGTLEPVGAALSEPDARADHQLFHRARDQHLARPGQCSDPGADVD